MTSTMSWNFDPDEFKSKSKVKDTPWRFDSNGDVLDSDGVPWDFDIKFGDLERWNSKGYVVGLGYMNGVKLRQDIDVMIEKESDTFNLFLLALRKMQNLPESDPMSYFQIASIHGYPKRPWNKVDGKILGVGGESYKEHSTNESGYCAHAMTQFPPWHRIYLVMLEQALFVQMVNVAKSYSEPHKGRYLYAATQFRLPYWDYFRPRGYNVRFPGIIDPKQGGGLTSAPYDFSLPKIFTVERISAYLPPNNTLDNLDKNPFHHLEFSDKVGNLEKHEWDFLSLKAILPALVVFRCVDDEVPPLLNRQRTHRHPGRFGNKILAKHDRFKVLFQLRCLLKHVIPQPRPGPEAPSTICRHRNREKTDPRDAHFNAATHAWRNSGSLEDFHNLYHLLLGGLDPGAHVSRVPIAAFDPAFWFHHGNIERIFSIWQRVNEGFLGSNWGKEDNSWFSKAEDGKKELLPFRKRPTSGNPATFWTADELKECTDFGYSYREFEENYTPSGVCEAFEDKYRCGEFWEWTIDAKVERLAMNGAFSILYYINDEREQDFDDKKEIVNSTLAGISYMFAAPTETCPNCKRQLEEGVTVDSSVAITSQLMDYIAVKQLKSLEYDEVKPFLIGHLRWRIVAANGERVDPRIMSTKKQLRIHVKAVKNHGRPINNDDPPEVYDCPSVVEEIIKNANRNKSEADVLKQTAAVSANNPTGFNSY